MFLYRKNPNRTLCCLYTGKKKEKRLLLLTILFLFLSNDAVSDRENVK